MPNRPVMNALAKVLVAGVPSVEDTVARLSRMLGKQARWLKPVAQRYVAAVEGRVRFRLREARRFLQRDPDFHRATIPPAKRVVPAHWIAPAQAMQPAAAARDWQLPSLVSTGALADWLWLNPEEVEWLADLYQLNDRQASGRLRHYHYKFIAKRRGGSRLIEVPKPD